MAEGVAMCDGCHQGSGDFMTSLSCGHHVCGMCYCLMDSRTTLCPVCEGCLLEDPDSSPEDLSMHSRRLLHSPSKEGLPESSVSSSEYRALAFSGSSKESVHSASSGDSTMYVDDNDKSGSKMKEAENENNDRQAMDTENAASPDCKDNMYLQLDEALVIANNTLYNLNSALQALKVLETKNKLQERGLSNSIHETFWKFMLDLKKRKSDLLRNVRSLSEICELELQDAFKNLEKQIKSLETRIAFAKGLQQSPLMSVYCDLTQLVADLKMSSQNEETFEHLRDPPDIRFIIDSDSILKIFDNLGAIYSAGSGTTRQSIPDENAAFQESQDLDVNPERENPALNLKDSAEGSSCELLESDFEYMNTDEHNMDTHSAAGKYLPAFQQVQSLSNPDVIIEEIIEEDQSCLPEPQNNAILEYTKEKPLNIEFRDCKPKKFKKNQRMMGTCAPFCRKKTAPSEHVYLSHIVDPCNFYVQSYTQKRHLIMLERMLTTLNQTCSHSSPSDVLELGEIVAFQSILRKKWCRGNIVELIPLESKCIQKPCGPTRYKIEDLTGLTLFLLDYGGTENFVAARFARGCRPGSYQMMVRRTKVDDLHKILIKWSSAAEETIRSMPPFALHCSLDIIPQSPDGLWTKDIRDHILRLVGNKSVTMKVLREEHDKLIVDLKKPYDSKVSSDMPMSLREALVLSELAKFPSNVSTAPVKTVVTRYKDPILPETEVEVVVCHVNDPSEFYIHVVGDTLYRATENKIQEVYASGADDLEILCPVVGQPCVAKYNEDDQWYRAEILALPNPEVAIIKYVDFGDTVKVNVTALRRLKEEFLTFPRKAICCRLAYIQPLNAELWWSSEARELFEDLTSYRRLRCTSIGVLLENKLSVELFDDGRSKETSINTMLVQEKLAAFILHPPNSGDHLSLKEVWDPVLDIPPNSLEKCMDNFSLFDRQALDVFISHVVSPSKIYVQWLTTENVLKRLEANMFDRYENANPEAVQCEVGMQVAVQIHSDKKWKRGKVIRVLSDSLVEVFCYDFGILEAANVTNVRALDENFRVYGTMCLECTLMDIQPAGGSENWTATACDFVSHYLCGATARVIIEDNASQWPLPVRILCKNEADKMVDVSDFLVKRGLALRERIKPNFQLEAAGKSAKLPGKSCLQEYNPVEECASEANPECTKPVASEQSDLTEPVMEPMVHEPYLPRLLPDEKSFLAKVSHVAEDGTIHVIQDCLENELNMLMVDIQNSFKCLGLMVPYSWKKGECCLIKGSDTMSYRGTVLEILGGDMITVQYEDFGYTEKLPKCHLYPSAYNSHIPRFCIPCHLSDILPVGDHWQPDAIQLLKELLLERVVTIHVMVPPKDIHGIASVRIYCGGASVAAILEQYAHGIRIGSEKSTPIKEEHCSAVSHEKIWPLDFQELLKNDLETPVLPKYSSVSLPRTGEFFAVEVTHIQTPNVIYICIRKENGDGDCDPILSFSDEINSEGKTLPHLTDFRTDMPCVAMYSDGLLHRAKLESIKSYSPVTCVVEFVDYGSTAVLNTSSLFQLPDLLIQYPARAIKVKLAGFKPPKEDFESQRLLYCPQWSIKSMYWMMDLLQKKFFFATCVAGSENTIFLYDDNRQLVHNQLISAGLAELDEV